jgi:hypothetical protein
VTPGAPTTAQLAGRVLGRMLSRRAIRRLLAVGGFAIATWLMGVTQAHAAHAAQIVTHGGVQVSAQALATGNAAGLATALSDPKTALNTPKTDLSTKTALSDPKTTSALLQRVSAVTRTVTAAARVVARQELTSAARRAVPALARRTPGAVTPGAATPRVTLGPRAASPVTQIAVHSSSAPTSALGNVLPREPALAATAVLPAAVGAVGGAGVVSGVTAAATNLVARTVTQTGRLLPLGGALLPPVGLVVQLIQGVPAVLGGVSGIPPGGIQAKPKPGTPAAQTRSTGATGTTGRPPARSLPAGPYAIHPAASGLGHRVMRPISGTPRSGLPLPDPSCPAGPRSLGDDGLRTPPAGDLTQQPLRSPSLRVPAAAEALPKLPSAVAEPSFSPD